MLNATVTKRIDVAPGLFIIQIKPDFPIPAFEAGQYVALGLPVSGPDNSKLVKRSYSIGSSPHDSSHLEFYIAEVPEGALTPHLAKLREGDRLWMAQKITGKFEAHEISASENLILVSTGTGIAPYISMLRTPKIWTPERKISLLHGVRFGRDLAYRDELMVLAEKDSRFRYYPIISRADPDWQGARGYVQSFFEKGLIVPDASMDNVFLCGNPAMIDQVTQFLEPKGFTARSKRNPEGRLHLEKYW